MIDGHRGRAHEFERLRSARLQPLLERLVSALTREGFSRDEAINFIAGIAYGRPGDHYSSPGAARRAVEGVLSGHANARTFGLDSMVAAMHEIADLLLGEANT